MKVNILLLFVLLNSNFAEELRNLTEHAILTKEYLNNPSKFLVNHSNEENFIAVFSNFTNSNGRELYNSYMQDVYLKDIQTILDDINNVKRGYGSKWKFDPVRKKYILPDKMRSYSDFYKWQMIIALLRTIYNAPTKEGSGSNLRREHFIKPYDVDIIDPPK